MNPQNMEGKLLKWTNYVMGWKARYFVLRGNILYYYLTKGEKVKGKIHLNVAEVIPLESNAVKFQIDTGTTMIYLCAEKDTDKNSWIEALLQVKKKESMVDQKPAPIINHPLVIDADSDNRLLKKIITTKNFLDDLSKNNNVLSDMIKKDELSQNSLSGVLNSYKVSEFILLLTFSFCLERRR